MKRLITLLLALCMLCGAAAMAEDHQITQNTQDGKADTTVTYTVEGGYTVVIPAAVTIPAGETKTTMTITLKQGSIFDGTLQVSLKDSANDFYLVKKDDETKKIAYSVSRADGNKVTFKEGSQICNNSASQVTYSDLVHTLALTLTGKATSAGEYTDTLTFEVKLAQ